MPEYNQQIEKPFEYTLTTNDTGRLRVIIGGEPLSLRQIASDRRKIGCLLQIMADESSQAKEAARSELIPAIKNLGFNGLEDYIERNWRDVFELSASNVIWVNKEDNNLR